MARRAPIEGPVQTISFRTRSELKSRLETVAAQAGRSLAQEAERRLDASFKEGEVADLETPSGVIFQAIRNSIDLLETQLKCNWWDNGNAATLFEGAIVEIAERLVRPFPDQKLYSNRLMKEAEADDPNIQKQLRERYLSDGAALARIATQEAFDRRDRQYPLPRIDVPERKTRRRKTGPSDDTAGE